MAEELKRSSKKRKRELCIANHPSVGGIFTRSQSQIYLSRNRSGRARLNVNSLRLHLNLPEKRGRRIVQDKDSSNIDDLSCILIKDLRMRRVFSNGFDLSGENEESKGFNKGKGRLESGFAISSSFNKDVNVITDAKANVSEDEDCQNLNDANPGLLLEQPKNYKEGDISNWVGGLCEDCVQSTPPDIDIFVHTKEVEVGFVAEKQSNQSDQKNSNISRRDGTNSSVKSLLTPCSRVKLVKAPGSFSYRRLLPYLMNISEDNSCGPKIDLSQKFKKGMEEKPLSRSHGQEIFVNNSTRESPPAESKNVDFVDQSKSTSIACIKESEKELHTGKNSSHALVSMAEEWSKPIMNRGLENFDIMIFSQEQNLGLNNSVSANSDDTNLMDNREIEKIDDGDSCDHHKMNNTNCRASLVPEKHDSAKDKEGGQFFGHMKQSITERVDKSDGGDSSEVRNLNHTDSNLSDRAQNENLSNTEWRDDDDHDGVLDHTDNSKEEYVQMTPPDSDFEGKSEVAESGGDNVKCMHNVDNLLGKPMGGSTNRHANCVSDKTIDCSNHRGKPVLNRCSRLKLFKTPGSISYRRMLPFLMDIAKDNSCTSGKGHLLKLGKSIDANPLSPSLLSDFQEMPIENSSSNDFHSEYQTDSYTALPVVKMASTTDQEPNSRSYKHDNESSKPLDSKQERNVHSENISETDSKLDAGPEITDGICGSNLPGTQLCSLSTFVRADAEQVAHASSANTGEDCNQSAIKLTDDINQIKAEILHQESSKHVASIFFNSPAIVSKKGILKRTPRGCRGFCTCLNCSSFRLNAEKAFEFSRNQMLDAEETAIDLIKELSHIRNMLEKSAVNANGHTLVCADQVKEVCRRASEAEELAQNRLSQMNFDLNIHCRVTCTPRPKVRFANYVEENVIAKSDLPSKYCFTRRDNEEN